MFGAWNKYSAQGVYALELVLNEDRHEIPRQIPTSRVLKKASYRLLKKIQRRGARKIDERRREPGGAKAQNEQFNPSRVLDPALGNIGGSPLQHRRRRAATSRWLIAFALEGLPLDRGVTLNCESGLNQTADLSVSAVGQSRRSAMKIYLNFAAGPDGTCLADTSEVRPFTSDLLRLWRAVKGGFMKSLSNQRGAIGWILLWALGIPIPILLVLFMVRGCT